VPFIIWGSRGIESTLQAGDFYCPSCDQQEEYSLKEVRPYFTLYFIPLFPTGSGQRYVECHGCRKTFKEEVLQYKPPTEAQRALGRIYDELCSGTSLQVLQKKLENLGMDASEAEGLLDKMCDSEPRHCSCGQSFHKSVDKCTNCGASL
jgi:hypothetical protein